MTTTPTATPLVHLIGAGLGDIGSLTRRAARVLAEADVVVLDRPSLDAVLELAPVTAERVHVGRHRGHRAWSTEAIVDLLADRATAGQNVVRIKGGDPFVCSRGAEEALGLAARGIAVQVTPGVTAGSAAGAASGIDRGASVTVVSGNHDPIGPSVVWPSLNSDGASGGAVVILTGRSHQGEIAAGIIDGGCASETAAALVHGVGRPDETVVHTELGGLGGVRLSAPAAMVVGPCRLGGEHAYP